MNNFQIKETLATYDRFVVFGAFDQRNDLPVVLKRCEYQDVQEAEFFIRSALTKARKGSYSRPLLSIFADTDEATRKSVIVFVWERGGARDGEVETDQPSPFPPGKRGYGQSTVLYTNPHTNESVERAQCLTLGKEVVIKIAKHTHLLEMNPAFHEALALAKCTHPNICDFFDFRLFLGDNNYHCAYIVMESLSHDLAMEIKERKDEPYEEAELMQILQGVTAALLHAKSLGLAHQDIKPHNILRKPNGLKVADFGAVWLKGAHSMTSSAAGTEGYLSPEAWKVMANPEKLQDPFASDIFSLGMTMLHLAAMRMPLRTSTMSDRELQRFLRQEVQELPYSEEFKSLLTDMLSAKPANRPSLQCVHEKAACIYFRPFQRTLQEADRLGDMANSYIDEGNYAKAAESSASAHAQYSSLYPDIDTANNLRNWGAASSMGKSEAVEANSSQLVPNFRRIATNLRNWGFALSNLERSAEAVEKHEAADIIYSQLQDDKATAINLKNWAGALRNLGRNDDAVRKYAQADTILSAHFPEDIDTANNLGSWGDVLETMGKREDAVEKYEKADAIFSEFFVCDERTAINLGNWGFALDSMGRNVEAVGKYATAHSIYSQWFPNDLNAAHNLSNWALALANLKSNEQAIAKHEEAHAQFSRLLPTCISAAVNLYNWGFALKNMGRRVEAAEKFYAARKIYASKDKTEEGSDCEKEIALLIS